MTKGERVNGQGTTGAGGEDRTWEFCLKEDSELELKALGLSY
jgi:25S rRNA (uracil2634-N3)-methyltransferase